MSCCLVIIITSRLKKMSKFIIKDHVSDVYYGTSLVRQLGIHRQSRYAIKPSSLNVLARDVKTHFFAGL